MSRYVKPTRLQEYMKSLAIKKNGEIPVVPIEPVELFRDNPKKVKNVKNLKNIKNIKNNTNRRVQNFRNARNVRPVEETKSAQNIQHAVNYKSIQHQHAQREHEKNFRSGRDERNAHFINTRKENRVEVASQPPEYMTGSIQRMDEVIGRVNLSFNKNYIKDAKIFLSTFNKRKIFLFTSFDNLPIRCHGCGDFFYAGRNSIRDHDNCSTDPHNTETSTQTLPAHSQNQKLKEHTNKIELVEQNVKKELMEAVMGGVTHLGNIVCNHCKGPSNLKHLHQPRAFLSPNVIGQDIARLVELHRKECLIFLVIDLANIPGVINSLSLSFLDSLRRGNVIIIGNKMDIIPQLPGGKTIRGQLHQIEKAIEHFCKKHLFKFFELNYTFPPVVLLSCRTMHNVHKLFQDKIVQHVLKTKHIVIVGGSNSGKSSLFNCLQNVIYAGFESRYTRLDQFPVQSTVSNIPGTTVNYVRHPFDSETYLKGGRGAKKVSPNAIFNVGDNRYRLNETELDNSAQQFDASDFYDYQTCNELKLGKILTKRELNTRTRQNFNCSLGHINGNTIYHKTDRDFGNEGARGWIYDTPSVAPGFNPIFSLAPEYRRLMTSCQTIPKRPLKFTRIKLSVGKILYLADGLVEISYEVVRMHRAEPVNMKKCNVTGEFIVLSEDKDSRYFDPFVVIGLFTTKSLSRRISLGHKEKKQDSYENLTVKVYENDDDDEKMDEVQYVLTCKEDGNRTRVSYDVFLTDFGWFSVGIPSNVCIDLKIRKDRRISTYLSEKTMFATNRCRFDNEGGGSFEDSDYVEGEDGQKTFLTPTLVDDEGVKNLFEYMAEFVPNQLVMQEKMAQEDLAVNFNSWRHYMELKDKKDPQTKTIE